MDSVNNIDKIENENDFREFICSLLNFVGFKIEAIREGAGSDGGRDIEATSFETDTAQRKEECVSWWIELKYRTQGNLGNNDMNDINSKIIRAANDNIQKFLLVTNKKLSLNLSNSLFKTAKQNKILLRIWDRDKINSILDDNERFSNEHSSIKKNYIKISDRNNETRDIINLIKSTYITTILIYGNRGIGKSLLAEYISQHFNSCENYGYGIINCQNSSEIGWQIKDLAHTLLNQGFFSEFTDTINENRSESSRINLLFEHIKIYKTIIVLDNFEYLFNSMGQISSKQIKKLLDLFSSFEGNGSVLLITSRSEHTPGFACQKK